MDDSSENINIKELSNTIFIDIYEIINNELYILGNIKTENINENVKVKINHDEIKVNKLYFPQKDYLNKYNIFYHSFEFKFSISEDKTYTIEFEDETSKKLDIDFTKHCNFSKIGGYSKTKKFISVLKNNTITIQRKTTTKWIKQETKAILNILKKANKQSVVVVPFRIAYLLGYPFLCFGGNFLFNSSLSISITFINLLYGQTYLPSLIISSTLIPISVVFISLNSSYFIGL